MSRIDDILAKQKALEDDLKLAKEEERDVVIKDIKEKIKMFDFKASDFKGLLKSRLTQGQVDAYHPPAPYSGLLDSPLNSALRG